MSAHDEQLFLQCVLKNPINEATLELGPRLGVSDRWLTAGALFQIVWNVFEDKDPQTGIRDHDLFYFDEDTSHEAENKVIARARELFKYLGVDVEVRNEARVHLWYEDHFGTETCCFSVTNDGTGTLTTYAPHGHEDLFARKIVPNPVLAPRNVYETKPKRWPTEWPSLSVQPWPADIAWESFPPSGGSGMEVLTLTQCETESSETSCSASESSHR